MKSLTEANPDFRRRLGYYFTGLSIGLVLMGLLFYARQSRAPQQQPSSPPPAVAPPPQ